MSKNETRQSAIKRILASDIETLSNVELNAMLEQINTLIQGMSARQTSSKAISFEDEWVEQQIEALKKVQSLIEQKLILNNASETNEERRKRFENELEENANFRKFLKIKLDEAKTQADRNKAKASLLQLDIRDELVEKEISRLEELIIQRDLGEQFRDWNNNIKEDVNSPKKGKKHYDQLDKRIKVRNQINDVRQQLGAEDDQNLRCRMLDEATGEQCTKSFSGASNRKRHEKAAHPDGTMLILD